MAARKHRDKKVLFADEEEGGHGDSFRVNEGFADSYNQRKRRQELGRARELGLFDEDGDGDSTTSSSSDEGDQLTPELDFNIMKTIEMIRNKDPRVYDQGHAWFDGSEGTKDDGEHASEKPAKRMTANDVVREQVLAAAAAGKEDAFDSDSDSGGESRKRRGPTYNEEQAALKKALIDAADDDTGDAQADDSGGLEIKNKTSEELDSEQQEFESWVRSKVGDTDEKEKAALERYLAKDAKLSDEDKFLRDYVLSRKWQGMAEEGEYAPFVPAGDGEVPSIVKDVEDEEEELDRVDDFERQYNFRFEDPDAPGGQIVTHARNVPGSMRRKDNKRQRQREERKRRKEQEKKDREEELKRLKNMRRQEMSAQWRAVREVAGSGAALPPIDEEDADDVPNEVLNGLDLDADFDPDAWDKAMGNAFGEDYYAEDDQEMAPVEDEHGDIINMPKPEPDDDHDEILKMHYEGVAGGVKTRFRYRQVPKEDYGLEPEDIIAAEDQELNQLVSLKKLAPFRDDEWIVPGRKRRRDVSKLRKKIEEEAPLLKASLTAIAGGDKGKGKGKGKSKSKSSSKVSAPAGDRADVLKDGDAAATSKKDEAGAGSKKASKRKRKSRSAKRAAAAAAAGDVAPQEAAESSAIVAPVAATDAPGEPADSVTMPPKEMAASALPDTTDKQTTSKRKSKAAKPADEDAEELGVGGVSKSRLAAYEFGSLKNKKEQEARRKDKKSRHKHKKAKRARIEEE